MALLALWSPALHSANLDRIAELAGDGSVMLRSPSGEDLVSINPDRSLIPASVLKIPLAQVALNVLGEDFRFETHFYQNDQGDLLIRGMGDPFLVSEEIERIANAIANQGLSEIRRLVMDDSAFEPNPDLPLESGANDPYAARNSALAVNFNTVNLTWDSNGNLISAEEQTPLTSVARELAAGLQAGATQRINLGDNPVTGLRQAQQLFQLFFERAGITVIDNDFYREAVSGDWTLLYRHSSSQSLADNLRGLLQYSNNFIANQLFLTLGAQQFGYPATASNAREVLQNELATLYGEGFGSDPESLLMIEGSGLARSQRSTAAAMMQILESFRPHAKLLTETNGALRKSGTLSGVYNFAGFIPANGELYPFVIFTNQASNHRATILQLLQDLVASER